MRRIAVVTVALALLAGPSLGACSDCCPPGDAPLSVSAGASCCGDCGSTVTRSPESASITATLDAAAPAAAVALAVVPPVPSMGRLARLDPPSAFSPPLSPPRPLRL